MKTGSGVLEGGGKIFLKNLKSRITMPYPIPFLSKHSKIFGYNSAKVLVCGKINVKLLTLGSVDMAVWYLMKPGLLP